MNTDLPFRAALIDAFIDHLQRLGAEHLRRIEASGTSFDHYYQTALQFAIEATRGVDMERQEAVDLILATRFEAIDAILAEALPAAAMPESALRAMARAAARALLVRQVPRFSSSAFAELWAPFRAHLSLVDLERDARLSLTRGNGGEGGMAAAG
jgi:hypothetical protein